MNLPTDALASVVGFIGAGASTAVLYIARAVETVPLQARGWMKLGGTLGLIGLLSLCSRDPLERTPESAP